MLTIHIFFLILLCLHGLTAFRPASSIVAGIRSSFLLTTLKANVEDSSFAWESAASIVATLQENRKWNFPKAHVMQVLQKALALVKPLPTLVEVRLPEKLTGRVNICGDTHGQFFDLLNILSDAVTKRPSSDDNVYIFNGDFVDRGAYSVEVPLMLLMLKVADPNCIHLLRGNHECASMNEHGGFADQCRDKYDDEVLQMFRQVFQALPVCAVVEGKIFVTHGGIGEKTSQMTIPELAAIDRFAEPFQKNKDTQAISELMWCDPLPDTNPQFKETLFAMNTNRGLPVGYRWGSRVTQSFLEKNKLKLLVRSHEVCMAGLGVQHDDKCVTVFSAPNYCDQVGNLGAVLTVARDGEGKGNLEVTPTTFTAVPHPGFKPSVKLMMG